MNLGRLLACALGATALASACSYTPPDVAPEIPENAQSSAVYAADGTLITVFHAEENRQDVTLARMPEVLQDAVVAIEDERFWEHHGVDVRAILRALSTNAGEGGVAQGGSTITQQLVKNTLTGEADDLERKIHEAALASSSSATTRRNASSSST